MGVESLGGFWENNNPPGDFGISEKWSTFLGIFSNQNRGGKKEEREGGREGGRLRE